MIEDFRKPRLTRYDDVALVVNELRKFGIAGSSLYKRITEIGPVDLDLLNEVLRNCDNPA